MNYSSKAFFVNDKPIGIVNYSYPNSKLHMPFPLFKHIFLLAAHTKFSLLAEKTFRKNIENYSNLVHQLSLESNYIRILQLGILRKHRGQGYSRSLVNSICNEIEKDKNIAGVQVATYTEDKVHIYQSLGFELASHALNEGLNCWVLVRENKSVK